MFFLCGSAIRRADSWLDSVCPERRDSRARLSAALSSVSFPLTMKTPDTSLKARERKIGGLGIFMVRKLMDEVSYAYADGKNILRTVKRF